MRRIVIKASTINEDELLELLDDAVKAISKECGLRGQDEYVDDVKWGKDRFEIPIFISPDPREYQQVAKFTFVFDPDDEDYPDIEDQMHVRLDEFLQEWNDVDFDEGYTSEAYIQDAIDEVTLDVFAKYRSTKSQEEMISIIKNKLESSYTLTEGEDFTTDDIVEIIDEYAHYWEEY